MFVCREICLFDFLYLCVLRKVCLFDVCVQGDPSYFPLSSSVQFASYFLTQSSLFHCTSFVNLPCTFICPMFFGEWSCHTCCHVGSISNHCSPALSMHILHPLQSLIISVQNFFVSLLHLPSTVLWRIILQISSWCVTCQNRASFWGLPPTAVVLAGLCVNLLYPEYRT